MIRDVKPLQHRLDAAWRELLDFGVASRRLQMAT